MFKKREDLQIRVPSDNDHGPNPYDSKTPLKDLTPLWLTGRFWIGLIVFGVIAVIIRKINGT